MAAHADGSESQREIIAFLSDQDQHGALDPARSPVEIIETHCAFVFLIGDHAFKLKKAVAFEFLDYSTIARREKACRRELEVNKPAGALYRGVRPVRRTSSGALFVDEDTPSAAETVDWLVWMQRFDRMDEMDRLLEADRVDEAMVHQLADVIHKTHTVARSLLDWGRAEDNWRLIKDVSYQLGRITPKRSERWAARMRQSYEALQRRSEQRRRCGFVRELHGDLHLGNIVLLHGPKGKLPTPFDAIEFSRRIATTDTLYDLAFTASDLAMRGRIDFANRLMSRYLAATRDYGGLALWPFWLSLRAGVRAMTAGLKDAHDKALKRLGWAEQWAEDAAKPEPRLIIVGGLSGSGKTSLARRLAPGVGGGVGAANISSDEARKRMMGVRPEQKLSEAAYRPEISGRLHRRIFRDAERALRAGSSVILDATFTDPRAQAGAKTVAERLGLVFEALWIDAPLDMRLERVAARQGDASDASTSVAKRQKPPRDLKEWTIVSGAESVDATLRSAQAALKTPKTAQKEGDEP